MSRRSSRRKASSSAAVHPSVRLGLESLVEGNEAVVSSMLSCPSGADRATLVDRLVDCMSVNNLSAESLLGRFFDASVLGDYCSVTLGKSGKGNEATLAARIAREWARPNFEPRPRPLRSTRETEERGEEEEGQGIKGEEEEGSTIESKKSGKREAPLSGGGGDGADGGSGEGEGPRIPKKKKKKKNADEGGTEERAR